MRRIAPLLLVVACTDSSIVDRAAVTPVASDARGVPRLLHAATSPVVAATATDAARLQLARIAPAYHVEPAAMPVLDAAGEVPVRGGTIVRLRQVIDGVPVEDGELRALVRPDTTLAVASGSLVSTTTPRRHFAGALDEHSAIARLGVAVHEARATRVWHRTGDHLIAAWVVEAYTATGDALHAVIADDGQILSQRSLVDDAAFSYRVFADTTGEKHPFDGPIVDPTPHPTGMPDGKFPAFVASRLVSVDGLDALADPWLPAGATETTGNNIDAYTDVNAPDGLTAGDFRATVTAPGVFDRAFDTAAEPLASQAQQMAAITSLFYVLNWLHDFWYDAGFTETAGNAQASNYGRGGIEGDAMHAEAQDDANGGSLNNANMATPGDGMSPRMQVFLWSGTDERSLAVANRTPDTNAAGFGPRSFDITAQVVLVNDGTTPSTDACSPLVGVVTGKIVLVDRGSCSFKSKALRVQQAGGVGMLLADNVASATPPAMGGDATITDTITIGSLSVTMAEGAAIKTNIANGTTTATLHRKAGVLLDGGLDSTLIAHEFGHYLHHRLQSCGTKMCGALSEGWGDFSALMLLLRPGDDLQGAYPFAVYPTRSFSVDPAYFGIRRAPYSINPAINSLSFRHMADGEALPTAHPFLPFGNNSEVHNAGEIWAETLFEAYVALQQAGTSFTDVRKTMQQYVVAGLLLAPTDATPTETRDAILAAAFAANPADHDILVAAFARRGMGSCAVSPPRTSTDFTGIVESSDVRGRAEVGAATVAESADSCDSDGVLDAGETARIMLPVGNPGHVAVGDVTVTVTSTTPGITVLTPPMALGTLAPYTSMMLEVEIALDAGVTGPIAGELSLDVTASDSCVPMASTPLQIRLDVDELPDSSATDTFDALGTSWSPASLGDIGWTRVPQTALDLQWHGADQGTTSDSSLVSPMLTADADKPLVISFTHRYSFEFSDGTFFDGGVIEVSLDGQNWMDVADLGVAPGYTGTLTDGNPLVGRMAFTGDSPGYPNASTVTLDFGTQLAGKPFQIRFRIGTDPGVGGPGWEIDDVAFTGIVGTPFATVVADAHACAAEPPDDGGCCDAGPLRPGSATIALGVLIALTRRRRRKTS